MNVVQYFWVVLRAIPVKMLTKATCIGITKNKITFNASEKITKNLPVLYVETEHFDLKKLYLHDELLIDLV